MAAHAVDYEYLRKVVFGHSQNVLDPSRDCLFHSRLSRLLRNQGLSRLDELVAALRMRKNPELESAIAEAMTVNETSFFRDNRPFELLRTRLLPALIERRRPVRSLRFWSAACSTGQEAVSLAILMREYFSELAHWDIRIEGTDICAEVVERARAARYHRIEVNRGLPARFLVKYFDHMGEDWVAKNEIRAMCSFRQANLCAMRLPFSRAYDRFDIILLRNVMLYFSPETRTTLMEAMHRIIAPDGSLVLGTSEQADPSLWTSVIAGGTCFYQPKKAEGQV